MEFSTAHCLPPLPPKSQPLEQLSKFVLSDEDDLDQSEAEFLKVRTAGNYTAAEIGAAHSWHGQARERGLQVYLHILLDIPNVAWSKRFQTFLEPDSGEMAVFSEGVMKGIYGLQRSQFGLAVSLLQQAYMEDPLWWFIFPDPVERRTGLEHFMMCYVEASYYHGCA